jgi:hypothetical protein
VGRTATFTDPAVIARVAAAVNGHRWRCQAPTGARRTQVYGSRQCSAAHHRRRRWSSRRTPHATTQSSESGRQRSQACNSAHSHKRRPQPSEPRCPHFGNSTSRTNGTPMLPAPEALIGAVQAQLRPPT